MRKFLLVICLFPIFSIFGSEPNYQPEGQSLRDIIRHRQEEQEKILAKHKQHISEVMIRVKLRYQHLPQEKTTLRAMRTLSTQLIEEKKYGQELADLLDLEYYMQEYTYQAKGVYSHSRGPSIHSYPRHLCEPNALEAEIDKIHNQYIPPSFVDRDGQRHYAFMH